MWPGVLGKTNMSKHTTVVLEHAPYHQNHQDTGQLATKRTFYAFLKRKDWIHMSREQAMLAYPLAVPSNQVSLCTAMQPRFNMCGTTVR